MIEFESYRPAGDRCKKVQSYVFPQVINIYRDDAQAAEIRKLFDGLFSPVDTRIASTVPKQSVKSRLIHVEFRSGTVLSPTQSISSFFARIILLILVCAGIFFSMRGMIHVLRKCVEDPPNASNIRTYRNVQ